MTAVTISIRFAPLPTSAMADVTKPTIISGIRNLSNWSKMPLKVLNARTTISGANVPKPIPSMIAMMMRNNKGMLLIFIYFVCW